MPRPKISDKVKEMRSFYRPLLERKQGTRLYWNDTRINALGDLLMDWFEREHTKISLGSFCWEHKIPRQYIARFAKKSPYFNYCVMVIKSLLETRLLEMGMSGEIDKVIMIFSLKNIAGWSDKKEINTTLEVTSKVVELQLPKKKEIKAQYKVVNAGK